MSEFIGNIWEFETAKIRVIVAAFLDYDLDLSFDDSGEIADQLNSGELIAFSVNAKVIHKDIGELASDWLGGCIYKSIAEFRDHFGIRKYKRETAYPEYLRQCKAENREPVAADRFMIGSYFADMVATVISEARDGMPTMENKLTEINRKLDNISIELAELISDDQDIAEREAIESGLIFDDWSEHDCENCETPDRKTCGNCHQEWCDKCDPSPAALCHYCHGRGHSIAPLKTGLVYPENASESLDAARGYILESIDRISDRLKETKS